MGWLMMLWGWKTHRFCHACPKPNKFGLKSKLTLNLIFKNFNLKNTFNFPEILKLLP
jgi:hypothetical protein